MANTYFKVLNKSTQDKYKDALISSVQKQLKDIAINARYNILDEVFSDNECNIGNATMENIFKYYLLEQILKNNKIEEKFIDTANPDIKTETGSNKFYIIDKNGYKHVPEITKVNSDGSYTKIEIRMTSKYKIIRTFSIDHQVLSFSITDSNDNIVSDMYQVAEYMGLKKEYVHKYKYSGYSGNCNDLFTKFLNQITALVETGYYMDNSYNFYKWNQATKSFVKRNTGESSPYLTDYEFKNNNTIIRKEYTGMKKGVFYELQKSI